MNRLRDKVALITGAAMGIGEADARLFASEGAKVAVTDINEKEGRRVVDQIRNDGGEAVFVRLDVSLEADWVSAIAFTIETYGKLNILIQNAGISLGKNIEDTTLDEWNRVMLVNSTGTFLGNKHAIKAMKGSGENCAIVNRSSIDGQVAEAGLAAYWVV